MLRSRTLCVLRPRLCSAKANGLNMIVNTLVDTFIGLILQGPRITRDAATMPFPPGPNEAADFRGRSWAPNGHCCRSRRSTPLPSGHRTATRKQRGSVRRDATLPRRRNLTWRRSKIRTGGSRPRPRFGEERDQLSPRVRGMIGMEARSGSRPSSDALISIARKREYSLASISAPPMSHSPSRAVRRHMFRIW